MRYYRLTGTDGGTLPADGPLRIGTIIRVARRNSRRPGAQWNPAEVAWVTPIWTECADPAPTPEGPS